MPQDSTSTGHIVTHTHWDREWRTPVWNSRYRLIIMMRQLLDQLDKNPQLVFLFDGQVLAIEDYLDVCPQMRTKVEELIKSDRIQIGPWYNLPDTYPVCGEALVRNLLIGRKRANQLGGCLNIAYTTFGWGQPSQFPQIYSQFGIKRIVSAKNVSKNRAPNSEFLWQSPDGTALLSTRLGVEKRANFFFFTVMPTIYGRKYSDPLTRINWAENGWFFHSADSAVDTEITFIPEPTCHPEIVSQSIEDAWQTTAETLIPEHVFMGNGCDSTAPSNVVDLIVSQVNANDPGKKLIYSDLNGYFQAVEKTIAEKGIELKTVYGELRDGPVPSVSANALATRMPLKVLNRQAQKQLIRYGEAFASLAAGLGIDFPHCFIDKAWQYLLLAHSHDALNGVTLDKTADDTAYKLNQVIELGRLVMDITAKEILLRADLSAFGQDDILLALFNPTPSAVEQVVKVCVDIPQENKCRRLEAYEAAGGELLTQPIDHVSHAAPVCVQNSRALPFYADRHQLYLNTGSIPAYGYKVIKLKPCEPYDDKLCFWHCEYEYGSQVTGPNTMENEHLRVVINSNGTFELTCKKTNRLFTQLGYYEDTGDVGDYWQRVRPGHNQTLNTLGLNAEIALLEDGPLVTSYSVKYEMPVPVCSEKHERFAKKRSDEKTALRLETIITLRNGAPYVEIASIIENTAKDHTLRVCFPSDIHAEASDAMGHFNVDKRSVNMPYKQDGTRDAGMSTLPMQNFVDISDGKAGLAILSNDLIEFEISQDARRVISLTLLRCVDVYICTEGRCATVETAAAGPQCPGTHTYKYALMPHAGNWLEADVYGQMERFVHMPRAYQISRHDRKDLPVSASLLKIDNPAVQIAAVKPAESGNGIAVRIYNPTSKKQKAKIEIKFEIKDAFETNLGEDDKTTLEPDKNSFKIEVQPYKIVTVIILS